jgi:hypothetical protein
MAVGFRLAEILDHREPHRLRRPESEQSWVAYIQRNDLVTPLLELVSMIGELAANLSEMIS